MSSSGSMSLNTNWSIIVNWAARSSGEKDVDNSSSVGAVSYTHLTLPTKRIV